MVAKLWLRIVTVMFGVLLIGVAQANIPTVPNELYEAPVSYTHLDVYKRQLLQSLIKLWWTTLAY